MVKFMINNLHDYFIAQRLVKIFGWMYGNTDPDYAYVLKTNPESHEVILKQYLACGGKLNPIDLNAPWNPELGNGFFGRTHLPPLIWG